MRVRESNFRYLAKVWIADAANPRPLTAGELCDVDRAVLALVDVSPSLLRLAAWTRERRANRHRPRDNYGRDWMFAYLLNETAPRLGIPRPEAKRIVAAEARITVKRLEKVLKKPL